MSRRKRIQPLGVDHLEPRLVLSRVSAIPAAHIVRAHAPAAPHGPRTPGPRAFLNQQYDAYAADFRSAEAAYFATSSNSPALGAEIGLFQGYLVSRTTRMANDLVAYFNQIPVKLPRLPSWPGTRAPRTAIQSYLQSQILTGPSNLLTSVMAVPLPQDLTAPSLALYNSSINNTIQASRTQTIDGVMGLFRRNSSPIIDTRTLVSINAGTGA